MANSSSGDSSLDRLDRILNAFDPATPSMTVGTLAGRAGLPLATAYRLVDQLTRLDYLRKDGGGNLRLGFRLWELASRSSPALDLRQAAKPFMEDVQAVVGQHTQLGVLKGDEVLFIERLSAKGSVVNQAHIAGRLPVHLTSSGMVLLAFAPAGVQESYLRRHPTAGLDATAGPKGTAGPRDFRRILAGVRSRGYAALNGLVDEGATGVAVPVLGRGNIALAALGVVVASGREDVQVILPALLTGARGIARAVGEGPARPFAADQGGNFPIQ
jgi:DNA-binding IclR family transcriptional regulator